MVLRTLDRNLYYRFVDGRASDVEVADGVAEGLEPKVRSRRGLERATFEACVIASQMERDGRADTPLLQRYNDIVDSTHKAGAKPAAGTQEKHAENVLRILSSIRQNIRSDYGIYFRATVQRIELLSSELGEQQSGS